MRVLLNELTRINSHLVWLGTHAMDIGAMTVFLYCFREREDVLRLFEAVSGQRMMTSYFRIGGVALEPPLGWFDRVKRFHDRFPGNIDEYENLLTNNPIWRDAPRASLTSRRKMPLRCARPVRRCGPAVSMSTCAATSRTPATRISSSRCRYPTVGDVYARYLVRVAELRESQKIAMQALEGMPEGPVKGRRSEGSAARPREDEDADGSAHLSL